MDETTSKVVIRRDVVFNETVFQETDSLIDLQILTSVRTETVPCTSEAETKAESEAESEAEPEAEETPEETSEPEAEETHRYPSRQRAQPVRYGQDEYINAAILENNPASASVEEALSCDDSEGWKAAADSEYQSLIENKTWDLVELPSGRKTIGSKWVFKAKRGKDGEVERLKARLVAKGCTQKFGVDYDETF